MSDPVFAEGDAVRVKGVRGTFRIKQFHPVRGEVTLWGGVRGHYKMRTFESRLLLPLRRGDEAPLVQAEMAARGRR